MFERIDRLASWTLAKIVQIGRARHGETFPIARVRLIGQLGRVSRRRRQKTVYRELWAVLAICVWCCYVAVIWEIRPGPVWTGRIVSFGIVEQDGFGRVGSVTQAVVDLPPPEGKVLISLPNGASCRAGSAIEVEEVHALFGARFRVGPRGCSMSAEASVHPKVDIP